MEVEIFEEDGDNTLNLSDVYAYFTIDVYPESKTYESRMHLKDDVYYRTEKYEYRISTNPIRVEERLIERLDEPPQLYLVKDGVVLESEIRNTRKIEDDDLIADLNKEVAWHDEWFGNPISLYLLSKHPDIISPDEYRRYLRQLSEKIKIGTQKIEEALKSDNMGLQVTDEYEMSGRSIWIPYSKREGMSEEEVSKVIQHSKKVKESLFNENSKEYVGITEGEFRSGPDILKHIEIFLNKKEPPVDKAVTVTHKTSSSVKFFAFGFQWVWLFVLVSFALWLLSLVILAIQYSFTFAVIGSGILTLILPNLRKKK